jgi:hypothetical protein
MSTSPSSRGSARSTSQRPSTPDQTRPPITRTGSVSVAPKSEYLRNALHARRAQHAPTESPLGRRAASTPKPLEIKTQRTSPDMFDKFELSEEQTRPVSPIHRRRPSDIGVPRSKTSRQLADEIDKLKNVLMDANMRVELLKTNNSELQYNVTVLTEKVEALEPLEEENVELLDENDHLKIKIEKMEEEMERLKDDNDDLRKSNAEMFAINDECSSHFENQEFAVQEAADTIVALERDKAALVGELQKLNERVSALEDDTSRASTLVDGSTRCPSRVYSIDDSRPSTSHFDSDYYSQPDSPQVRTSKESIISITPSERSKKFLDLTQERRRSARDLAKRMSAASLKALRVAIPSPAPQVPQIPEIFQQQIPQIVEQVVADKRSSRAPRRYRERKLPEHIFQDALQISPGLPDATAPRSPTPHAEGLRGPYRPEQPNGSRSSRESLPSSNQVKTPTTTKSRHQRPSGAETSPRVPSRRSSRQANTSSSNELLSQRDVRNPRQRRQSEPDMGSPDVPLDNAEEWASMPPPPVPTRASVISQSSLTSEVDAQDKDRWWRSIDRLNQPQPQSYQLPVQHGARPVESQPQPQSPTLTRSRSQHPDGHGRPARLDTNGASNESLRSGNRSDARRTRTQPSTPAATTPHVEKDFMFNAAEDVDTFMRKAKARMGGRR